ncbi:MAG: D-alanine--D-alanine ligase, partial [Candidatus Omnitrophica bacterium]|nr:D-alanine--D-alanine ligase [Candidatus Omnitrophota bacterium]
MSHRTGYFMEKNLNGIKVGVLGGGVSSEREISLQSARQAFATFRKNNIEAVFIDITTSKEEKVKEMINAAGIDVAFIALHGEFGEDGKIQAILERLKLAYTGSGPRSSLCAMDKIISKEIFLKKNIPTAPFIVCSKDEQRKPFIKKYPVVVKPSCAGSSIGISVVTKEEQLESALREAFSFQDRVLIESYIPGKELTVGVLEERPLGVIEIVPQEGYFDFKTKYSDGMARFLAPAPLKGSVYLRVQEVALRAHQALGCRHFSRVDIRLDEEDVPYVLEVNSIPGLTSHSQIG